MDEELKKEIVELLKEQLKPIGTEVENIINTQVGTLRAEFTTQLDEVRNASSGDTDDEDKTKGNSDSEVRAALKALQDKDAARETEARNQRRDTAINDLAKANKVTSSNLFRAALVSQFGDKLTEQGGAWFVKQGDNSMLTLDDTVKTFLGTDDGKALLPSSGVNGTNQPAKGNGVLNSATDSPTDTNKQNNDQKIEALLAEAYSDHI